MQFVTQRSCNNPQFLFSLPLPISLSFSGTFTCTKLHVTMWNYQQMMVQLHVRFLNPKVGQELNSNLSLSTSQRVFSSDVSTRIALIFFKEHQKKRKEKERKKENKRTCSLIKIRAILIETSELKVRLLVLKERIAQQEPRESLCTNCSASQLGKLSVLRFSQKKISCFFFFFVQFFGMLNFLAENFVFIYMGPGLVHFPLPSVVLGLHCLVIRIHS